MQEVNSDCGSGGAICISINILTRERALPNKTEETLTRWQRTRALAKPRNSRERVVEEIKRRGELTTTPLGLVPLRQPFPLGVSTANGSHRYSRPRVETFPRAYLKQINAVNSQLPLPLPLRGSVKGAKEKRHEEGRVSETRRRKEMDDEIKGAEFIFALIATELRNCSTSKIAPAQANYIHLLDLLLPLAPKPLYSKLSFLLGPPSRAEPPPLIRLVPFLMFALASLSTIEVHLFDVRGSAFLSSPLEDSCG